MIPGYAGDWQNQLLAEARIFFYKSVSDKAHLEKAIGMFERLKQDEAFEGKSETYLGALVALKGKHAFAPHDKLKWVKRGLTIMDQGIAKCPNDIEALFIHGSTCYHIPFFFGRKGDAQRSFNRIIQLLPTRYQHYDEEIIQNVIAFILEKAELTPAEKNELTQISQKIGRQ
ncbi:hypothetical protein JXJ21_16065 [candidate division KSB1 bacterium]|nr:hypothetical protein [candidate division KSB1 bacterium]